MSIFIFFYFLHPT